MKVNVKGKILEIKDELASEMERLSSKVTPTECEAYIIAYYTDEKTFSAPSINELISNKSEVELSNAVNSLIEADLELMK